MYPPVPAEKRKPIRVLSLFDGIATGESESLAWQLLQAPSLGQKRVGQAACLPGLGVEGPVPIRVSSVCGRTCVACATPSQLFCPRPLGAVGIGAASLVGREAL